jgi:folate-binding protein YgfZ
MIVAGWPSSAEFEVPLTPQTFGAAFVNATVSFTKGCFTGQELVGRLDARGSSVPWRLVRCVGASVQRVDDVLRSKGPDGPKGVTTVVATPQGVVALGIAHRTLLDPTYLAQIDDVTVEAVQ